MKNPRFQGSLQFLLTSKLFELFLPYSGVIRVKDAHLVIESANG